MFRQLENKIWILTRTCQHWNLYFYPYVLRDKLSLFQSEIPEENNSVDFHCNLKQAKNKRKQPLSKKQFTQQVKLLACFNIIIRLKINAGAYPSSRPKLSLSNYFSQR